MLSLPGYISMMGFISIINRHAPFKKIPVLKVGVTSGFLKPYLLLFVSVMLLGRKLDNLT